MANGKFRARYAVNNDIEHLGTFDTAVEAAVAYAKAVKAGRGAAAQEEVEPAG